MSRWWISFLFLAATSGAGAQTFGRVVAIGGHSSDLVLDESRRVVYVANFTANRIDVVSVDSGEIERGMNVSAQPSSVALSPDNRFLVVTHYANFAAPGTPSNGLTVIDLNTGGRQSFALADPPFGAAFGVDGKALVVTSTQFILFDPAVGSLKVIDTIAGVTAKTLPQPPATFPTQIVGASMQSSRDLTRIHGVTDSILFSYDAVAGVVRAGGYVASPTLGPRAVSVSRDGSYHLAGWVMFDRFGLVSQFPSPSGELNIGGHAIDSDRGLIYAQIPKTATEGATSETAPVPFLMVADADNLTVREKLQLPENLSGKAVLSSDGETMYGLSESGILILPVGQLNRLPRIAASKEDLVFRSNFCNAGALTQEITIYDLGGGEIPFSATTTLPGVSMVATSLTTPAVLRVTIDPTVYRNQKGTIAGVLSIDSPRALNFPVEVRLLVNLPEPDQRGTAVNVPGQLVDLLSDPQRNRFFVLRQDRNEVLVYDGSNYQLITRLRTGNTPTSMAVTFDRRWLLVGNDNSQYANVFDLETLEPSTPIRFPFGHYPRWIAASGRAILAASRVAGPKHVIDQVDFHARFASELPTLGIFENNIDINTALIASGNGSSILAAQADGTLLLYNANVDTFTISRKLPEEEVAGAIAASNFDQFVVGNKLMNASLVATAQFDSTVGQSSGFVFVDQSGLRSGAPSSTAAGVIQRIELSSATGMRSTRIVEAPVLGLTGSKFTRTLAVLPNRSAFINLTVSGFTVLAWNYDASVAVPRITGITNAADKTRAVAPGGLVSITGSNLSAVNIATKERPLPLALGESCLTVNGLPVPMLMVSPELINAQLPFTVDGNVSMVLRTPGGVSDSYNVTILPYAPSVFRTPVMEGVEVPTVVRDDNGQPATPANPIRHGDRLTIYLTGMGRTDPEVPAGVPAPSDPVNVLTEPTVEINGVPLAVESSRLTPGEVGVYEIKCFVPGDVQKGLSQTMRITQGGYSTALNVRVVD